MMIGNSHAGSLASIKRPLAEINRNVSPGQALTAGASPSIILLAAFCRCISLEPDKVVLCLQTQSGSACCHALTMI